MPRPRNLAFAAISFAAVAGLAVAQPATAPKTATGAEPAWVAPGTPGSPIDGDVVHAQVLLSQAGFSGGVIDGKDGMSFKAALRGFQHSRGLDQSGKHDGATRAA